MWPNKKKSKSAPHRRIWWVGWGRGVFRKKINLQRCKSNWKFYRGENLKSVLTQFINNSFLSLSLGTYSLTNFLLAPFSNQNHVFSLATYSIYIVCACMHVRLIKNMELSSYFAHDISNLMDGYVCVLLTLVITII